MAKIIFIINNMNFGGIQKSLLELLKVLSKENIDLYLYCCNPVGVFYNQIPRNVTIIPSSNFAKIIESSSKECKRFGLKFYLLRIVLSLWTRVFGKSFPARIICRKIKIEGLYDYAISYAQPLEDHLFCGLTNEIVLNCINARKKITFLHCDFSLYGGNTELNRKLYTQFDAVAAVSNSVGRKMVDIIPELSNKIFTVRNCYDIFSMRNLAEENTIQYSKKTFVSVCRLSSEKGLFRCLPIIFDLRKKGLDFEWHIIGDGNERELLHDRKTKLGLDDVVFMHGAQKNPYRFMKNASFIFVPSFHEAAPIVFDEAKALGIPILTTNTLSAREIVGDTYGIICDNNIKSIQEMLSNAMIKNLDSGKGIENTWSLQQFMAMLESVA